jgi:hypothetical protein
MKPTIWSRGDYPAVNPVSEKVPTFPATGGENAQAERQVAEDNALMRAVDKLGDRLRGRAGQ